MPRPDGDARLTAASVPLPLAGVMTPGLGSGVMTPPLPTALWTTIRVTWADIDEGEREQEFTLHPHHIHAGEWVGADTSFWAGVDEPTDITGFEVLASPPVLHHGETVKEIQEYVRRETAAAVLNRVHALWLRNSSWSDVLQQAREEFGVVS